MIQRANSTFIIRLGEVGASFNENALAELKGLEDFPVWSLVKASKVAVYPYQMASVTGS